MNELHIDKTHWKKTKIGELLYKTEYNDKEHASERYNRFIKMEHLDAYSLNIHRWGDSTTEEIPPTFYKVFKQGQILYPTRNPQLKRTALASFDGICGEKTLTLSLNEDNDGYVPFIAHVFHSSRFIEYATNARIGSTNPHIRWRDVADYEFLLPPKAEQKRLAELLWAADEVVEKEKREMEAIKVFKDRQMSYLLNGYQHTQNDGKPDGWERLTISDLGVVSTSSVDKKQRPKEKTVSLINYMDVYTSKTKKITSDIELMQVTAPDKQIKGNQVNIGDILFTPSSETKDDIGHSAVVYEDLPNTLYSYHLVRLRFNREIDLDFKRYLFNNPSTLAYFTKRAQGITRMTLSLDDFNETPVLLPPLSEQRQIALKLSSIDSAIERIEKSIWLSQQIKQELINKVF